MMYKHKAEKDLTQGSILRLLIRFSIPLLIGDIFQQFYNLADSIIVGRFVGKAALAAVGSTTPLINTIIGLFTGCSVGAGVVISRHYGAKDINKLSDSVHTTVAITLLFSVCFTVTGMIFAPKLLLLVSTPSDVFETALIYLRIYFAGISGLVIYNMSSGILRAIGDSQRPIYALIISTVGNVVLDLVLVVVFHWGVAGAAYATILSQFLSAGYLIYILCRGTEHVRLQPRKIMVHRTMANEILSIGVPYGLQRTITAFSNTIVQSYVNAFGSDYMAGWAVYNKVHQFAVLPMENISAATVTFVGQNYGAKNWSRVKESVFKSGLLNFCVTLACSYIVYLFAEPFARMFSEEQTVVHAGVMFLHLLSMLLPISVVMRTFASATRGLGFGKGPMVCMLLGNVLIRQMYLAYVSNLTYSVQLVALSYPVGWLASGVLIMVYYCWVAKEVKKNLNAA